MISATGRCCPRSGLPVICRFSCMPAGAPPTPRCSEYSTGPPVASGERGSPHLAGDVEMAGPVMLACRSGDRLTRGMTRCCRDGRGYRGESRAEMGAVREAAMVRELTATARLEASLEEGYTLPAAWYTAPEHFRREQER